jgi:repressor of nif and glnA expression
MGHKVGPRSVRLYLKDLDDGGYTETIGRKGRIITDKGRNELMSARTYERVGFLATKIDQMTYRMSFNLMSHTGTVIMNTTLIDRNSLSDAIPLIQSVFEKGFSMGELLTLFGPGSHNSAVAVPEDSVAIGTICSITLNGVLLRHSIQTHSRFGGLLEFEGGRATRFVEIIRYDGTTLDPLEIFIRSGMADYEGVVTGGDGRIGASLREMPADSRERVLELEKEMRRIGLGGYHTVGLPGHPLMEIPIPDGRIGAVVMGGLNPVAILEEKGIPIRHAGAISGLVDFREFFHYGELTRRAREIL